MKRAAQKRATKRKDAVNELVLPESGAQALWSDEQEEKHVRERLNVSRDDLALARNNVWALEALVKVLEERLEDAQQALVVPQLSAPKRKRVAKGAKKR